MPMTRTIIQLDEEQLRLLDRRAAREGVSRAEVIRIAVDAYLGRDREAEVDRRIVEGYVRVPASTPDEWGDLGAWHDAVQRAAPRPGDLPEGHAEEPDRW